MTEFGYVNSRTNNLTDLTFTEMKSVNDGFIIVILVFTGEPNLSLFLYLVSFTGIAYLVMNTRWLKNRI